MLFLYWFPVNLIVGVGIYHSVSLLNHSCQPNCVAVFNGTKLMIRVTENIQPGQELTISYTELLAPSFKRKEELRKQYFFDCCCIRCSSAKEEDGLLLSMKCFNSSCNGTVLLLQGILTLRGTSCVQRIRHVRELNVPCKALLLSVSPSYSFSELLIPSCFWVVGFEFFKASNIWLVKVGMPHCFLGVGGGESKEALFAS